MTPLSTANRLVLRSLPFRIFLATALATLLVLQLRYSMTSGMEPDEVQFLSNGFAMTRGEKLYVDVWDNHGPATNYLLAWGLSFFDVNDPTYYVTFRQVGTGLMLVVAAMMGLWAGRFLGNDWWIGVIAATLLLSTAPQYLKGHELRPDNALTLLWIASLLCWFEGWRSKRLAWFFLGGLLIGAGFWFSIKTLILGFSVGLMFLAAMWRERRLMIWPVLLYGLGSAMGPVLMAGWLATDGNLAAYWASNIGQNFDRDRPTLHAGYIRMLRADPIWIHANAVALGYAGWCLWRREAPAPVAVLYPAAFFVLFQYLFLLPTHHLQSFLFVSPPIIVLLLWSVADASDRFLRPSSPLEIPWRGVAAGVALGVFPLWTYVDQPREADLEYDLMWEAWLLEVVPEDVPVMSGDGNPITRDQPFRYKSYVQRLRALYNDGLLDIDLVEGLDEKDVPYAIYEDRLTRMGDELPAFLSKEYIPLKPRRLLGAGKVIPDDSDGSAEFRIAGEYYWAVPGVDSSARRVRMDGRLLEENPVRIDDGRHVFEWAGEGHLVLCVAPPEHWGNWEVTIDHDLPRRSEYPEKLFELGFW